MSRTTFDATRSSSQPSQFLGANFSEFPNRLNQPMENDTTDPLDVN